MMRLFDCARRLCPKENIPTESLILLFTQCEEVMLNSIKQFGYICSVKTGEEGKQEQKQINQSATVIHIRNFVQGQLALYDSMPVENPGASHIVRTAIAYGLADKVHNEIKAAKKSFRFIESRRLRGASHMVKFDGDEEKHKINSQKIADILVVMTELQKFKTQLQAKENISETAFSQYIAAALAKLEELKLMRKNDSAILSCISQCEGILKPDPTKSHRLRQ